MKGVILQPSYLPWIGYFDLIRKADKFVFYDDVQFTYRDWRSRNRIKTPQGIIWLTVPIKKIKERRHLLVKDALIDNNQTWAKKQIKTLERNYKRSKYFNEISNLIFPILKKEWKYLIDLNVEIINVITAYLNLHSEFLFSSDLNIKQEGKTDKLIEICQILDIDIYITGNAAQAYIDENKFKDAKIDLVYHNYIPKKYPQLWGKFVPYLSVVDLLYNMGKNSIEFI